MKQLKRFSLSLCLAIALLAGCTGSGAQTQNGPAASEATALKKTLRIGDTTFNAENWEETIDPHTTYNGWPCLRYGVGETLVHYTDTMELEPWLAESWENDGGLVWTITLREGIKFSSGRAMDGEAVKQCLEHLLEHHDRAPGDTKITDIQADGMVVTVTTSEPVPALMNYLGDPYGCMIDVDASDFETGIVIGTGPYRAVELVTDDHLTLEPNELYWNGKPKLDQLTIRTLSNGDTLAAALKAGDIDAAYGMAYEAYPDFENANYQFSAIPTSRAFFGSMNMTSPVMQEDAVRTAIAMGIDKDGFVKTLLEGHGSVANGAFPDGFSTFGGEHVRTEHYDPEGARFILEEAGWKDLDGDGIREKDGTKLVIRWLTYPSRQELPLLAEAAQASLKEIGVEVDINNTPNRREFLKDMTSWDIYVSALVTAPSGDPQYFFTTSCLPGMSYNFGEYDNAHVTELIHQLSGEFDPAKRGELAIELQQAILDDHAYVFCSFLEMNMISRSNVSGWTAHACDYYEVTADLDIER
ncbi:MAG: ABC transporter substrate-binding protein [Solobacterium sp.]|nr:ABC transporter substrate-binding protein [Solobacterium sp.]